jgi:hypothetical protein
MLCSVETYGSHTVKAVVDMKWKDFAQQQVGHTKWFQGTKGFGDAASFQRPLQASLPATLFTALSS